jgi:hypothetical protein
MTKIKTKMIEQRLGKRLIRGWILDGAGPARFGWGSIHPCQIQWEGRTLAEIAARLDAREARVRDASYESVEDAVVQGQLVLVHDVDGVESIHGITGQAYEVGTLTAGTWIRKHVRSTDGYGGLIDRFQASTDGGVTWYDQRSRSPIEARYT